MQASVAIPYRAKVLDIVFRAARVRAPSKDMEAFPAGVSGSSIKRSSLPLLQAVNNDIKPIMKAVFFIILSILLFYCSNNTS